MTWSIEEASASLTQPKAGDSKRPPRLVPCAGESVGSERGPNTMLDYPPDPVLIGWDSPQPDRVFRSEGPGDFNYWRGSGYKERSPG